jgi:hypothetical protein
MNQLLEHLLQERIDEFNWKAALGAAALGVSAVASPVGGTADAATKAHHRQVHRGLPHKTYSEQEIINSIVGEESQSYRGMVAVANAIRNRMKDSYYKDNILHGVYGRTADHVRHEKPEVFAKARKAWAESATHDITDGAIFWGNSNDVSKFQQQAWFRNVEFTTQIDGHYFFRMKK